MGAGLSRQQIASRVRYRLNKAARELNRSHPDKPYFVKRGVLYRANENFTVRFRILRASNGEVAGIPYVEYWTFNSPYSPPASHTRELAGPGTLAEQVRDQFLEFKYGVIRDG